MVNGEITWEAAPHKQSNSKFEKRVSVYLKLEKGSNKVRFITNPFVFFVHNYQAPGAKYPKKVRCAKNSASDPCPLCDKANAEADKKMAAKLGRKPRYLAGVIDRRSNEIKVLEFNSVVYDTILVNKEEEDLGPPIAYDYNIKMDPDSPSPMNYYQALPIPKKPLTAEEQEKVDTFDKQTLINLAKVPELHKIMERIAKLDEEAGGVKEAPKVKTEEVESASSTASVSSSDDEDFLEYGK